MRYAVYAVPVVVFLAVGSLFYKGLELNPTYIPSPLLGKPAPVYELPTLRDPAVTTGTDDLQARNITRFLFVGFQQCDDHCRYAEDDRCAFTFDQIEDHVWIEQADQHHLASSLQAAKRDHAATAGVEHRHDVDPRRALVDAAARCVEARVVDKPTMAEDRAFGKAGGSRRVLDLGGIAGFDDGQRTCRINRSKQDLVVI